MAQTLYHRLSRLALAKAIKTPDDNDPYSEPWSKSIIFTQPFAVELQKQAQAFDMNQRTKSQRKPRKKHTCLSSDSEDSETEAEIVPSKHHPRNKQHQHHPRRENWKMTQGHSRGSSQTPSSSTDGSSVDDHYNKKKHIKHIHIAKHNNSAYEDQDPYYRKNRPMMDPVYYQNQHQQQHMHALALQQQAALERRHHNNKTKTRITNTDMRRRAEMMRNANDNKQPATPMPRSKDSTGPKWSM
ncbi:hypothetical protein K501DRAFT_330313 [Backusella circina FSU 941]|nr:hypothetical protein K501DRAFT_330313 [Backusella circina FSU 941]